MNSFERGRREHSPRRCGRQRANFFKGCAKQTPTQVDFEVASNSATLSRYPSIMVSSLSSSLFMQLLNLLPSFIQRRFCLGEALWAKYGLQHTWSASSRRLSFFRRISSSLSVRRRSFEPYMHISAFSFFRCYHGPGYRIYGTET